MKLIRLLKSSAKSRDVAVVAAVVVLAGSLLLSGLWVFQTEPPPGRGDPFWRAVLSDRATLGLVRMVAAALAVYALASIAVLIVRGRWMRAISTTGFEADDAEASEAIVDKLEAELRAAREHRDAAWRLVWRLLHG